MTWRRSDGGYVTYWRFTLKRTSDSKIFKRRHLLPSIVVGTWRNFSKQGSGLYHKRAFVYFFSIIFGLLHAASYNAEAAMERERNRSSCRRLASQQYFESDVVPQCEDDEEDDLSWNCLAGHGTHEGSDAQRSDEQRTIARDPTNAESQSMKESHSRSVERHHQTKGEHRTGVQQRNTQRSALAKIHSRRTIWETYI